jgi:chitodextrinase
MLWRRVFKRCCLLTIGLTLFVGLWPMSGVLAVTVDTTDTTPPGEVTGLAENHTDISAELAWVNPVELDFSHVNVYRDGALVGTSTALLYLDTGLTPQTIYQYTVKTVDTSGNESVGVGLSLTTDADLIPPGEITGLTEAHTDTIVDFAWTNPTDSDFSHINVYRDGVSIGQSSTGVYRDSGLAAATLYAYRFEAVDTSGNKSLGVTLSVTTTEFVNDNSTDFTYTVNWTANNHASAKGGSYHETNVGGEKVAFSATITAHNLYIIYNKGTDRGIFDVYVDGVKHSSVDAYHTSLIWNQRYAITGLSTGTHQIEIVNSGSKNALSTGTYFTFEGYEAELDKSVPSVAFGTNGSEIWAKSAATTVTVSDDLSGVSDTTLEYAWSYDTAAPLEGWLGFANGANITDTDYFTSAASGDLYLHVRATDLAGNAVTARSNRFRIDHTAPGAPVIETSAVQPTSNAVTFSLAGGTDLESGVLVSQYKLGAFGAWTDYSGTVTISAEGTTIIYARTIDHVGNISAETSTAVEIDYTVYSGLRFDGVDDYVMTPNMVSYFSNSTGSNETVTIEVSFLATSEGVIIDERGENSLSSYWHDSQIEILSSGEVRVRVWQLPAVSLGTVAFGTWNHAVVRYNKATSTLDGLLNGNLSATNVVGDRYSPWENGHGLYYAFGAADWTHLGSGKFFQGVMGEVRVWNVARTDQEIRDNMHLELSGAETGLVGYWKFNDYIDKPALDSTAYHNDAAIYGAVKIGTDTVYGSMAFDGVDDFVKIPDSTSLNIIGSELTIESWIQVSEYPSSTTSTYPMAFINKESQYEIGISSTGEIGAAIDTASGSTSWVWIGSGYTLPLDTWTHVSVSYDGTYIHFYVNGQLVASVPNNAVGPIGSETTPLRFGARDVDLNGVEDYFVQIQLDEVRIWSKIRTAAEIAASMNKELTGAESGLAGYWKLNERLGDPVLDSANGSESVVTGAARVNALSSLEMGSSVYHAEISAESANLSSSVSVVHADGRRMEVTGAGVVHYVSSNPLVATVDHNGVIKAISPGTAVIVAEYKGQYTVSGVTVDLSPTYREQLRTELDKDLSGRVVIGEAVQHLQTALDVNHDGAFDRSDVLFLLTLIDGFYDVAEPVLY